MNRKVNASGLGQLFMDAMGASPDYRGRADAYLKRRQLELKTRQTDSAIEKNRAATEKLNQEIGFQGMRNQAAHDNADRLERVIHLKAIGPKQEQLQNSMASQLDDNFQPIREEDLYADRIAGAWDDVFKPRDNAPQLTATSHQELLSSAELAIKNYAESVARMQSLSGASASPSGVVEGAVAFNDALPNLLSSQAAVGKGAYGPPPSGHAFVRDENGNIVTDDRGIPEIAPMIGSSADIKAREKEDKDRKNQDLKERYSNIVIDEIDRSLDTIKNGGFLNGVGATSLVTRHIPGADGYKIASLFQTIKANAGFDRLQAMRDASQTGGALGQVTELELAQLQAAIGNLDQAQSEEELIYNLLRVKKIYQEIIHGHSGIVLPPPPGYKNTMPASSATDEEETEALVKMYAD